MVRIGYVLQSVVCFFFKILQYLTSCNYDLWLIYFLHFFLAENAGGDNEFIWSTSTHVDVDEGVVPET